MQRNLPYKPKRRTRATIAKEAGLEPLADKMYNVTLTDPLSEARKYVGDKVASVEDALAGARDIIAERINEDPTARNRMRNLYRRSAMLSARVAKGKEEEGAKYSSWFDWQENMNPEYWLINGEKVEFDWICDSYPVLIPNFDQPN